MAKQLSGINRCIFLIVYMVNIPSILATARFTHFPPNVVYASSGGTARFVWDYYVVDRRREFQSTSPVWDFIDKGGNERTIGNDDKLINNWSFVINNATCPPRLRNPDRVSRESNATLVITDVTTADNGIYRCTLKFKAIDPIANQVQLVVTVRPTFLSSHPNKTYQIIEGKDLKINCTATGPPTPNITLANITDGSVLIKTQGSGSAVLHMKKITRYHAGEYECRAGNNPNENATTTRTCITVYYKPTILKKESSSKLTSWNGRQVTLNCTVDDGEPLPNITWYKPNGDQITTGVTAVAKKSEVVITTKERADYGSYKCKATNVAGSVEHNVIVTQLFPPGAPNVTILDQDIQASSATVRWTKPGYDGGRPVIDYKVQINTTNPSQKQNTAKTEHKFTELTKNTRYEVRVYARNVAGYGNASIVVFTTKKRGAPPLPSLHLSQSKTTITLYWTKPDENGGTIESYTIYQKQGVDKTWTRIHVVRDLSNLTYVIQLEDLEAGQTYWFIVTAKNEFGKSEIGSSDKGKACVLPKVTTVTPTPTTESVPNKNERKGGGDDKASPIVIAAAVGAVVFFLIAAVIIVIILRKKNILGRGTIKSKRSDRAAYHNDIDPDNVTQQGAAASLGGVDDGIPTYAAVDISKKKKKNVQDALPNYAAVDKTKKKRPGEIIYAELADFNSPGTTVEEPRPITYTGTDYADISQFQKQDEPEPTYANFTGQSKKFTNIQDK